MGRAPPTVPVTPVPEFQTSPFRDDASGGWKRAFHLIKTRKRPKISVQRSGGGQDGGGGRQPRRLLLSRRPSHLRRPPRLLSPWPLSGMSLFRDTCLPSPFVSPSRLLLGGVELFVFRGLFTGVGGGVEEYPRCSGASTLSAHHAEHDSPPSLRCRDELFLPIPRGLKLFCLRFPTSLPDSRSIPRARASVICFRRPARTLCDFAPCGLRFGAGLSREG